MKYPNIPPDDAEIALGAFLPDADEIMARRRLIDEVGFPGFDGQYRQPKRIGLPCDREDED